MVLPQLIVNNQEQLKLKLNTSESPNKWNTPCTPVQILYLGLVFRNTHWFKLLVYNN